MKNSAQTTLFKACRKYITFLIALLISYNSAYAQLSGYSFKKKITIDNAKVSGTADLTDFPFLISLTDTDLRTIGNAGDVTDANGYDIVFTASDGTTLLDHEIEKYVATTGEYEAWVRIPTLDYNDDTDIYLYYGNASVSTDPSTSNTWDANYKGVWHLNDDFLDGTANNNDGTNNGSTDIDGKMGDGQSFDGADDYIDAGSDASLDNIFAGGGTIEAWINPASFGESDFGRVLVKSTDNSTSNGWSFIVDDVTVNDGMMFNHDFSGATGRWTTPDLSIVTSTWHHLVVTYDNGSVTNNPIIYINGASVSLVEFATPTGTAVSDAAQDVWVGNILNQSRTFDGLIDEARISNTIRSADWIATEFNNQDDPSAFYNVGSEEPTGAPGNVSTNLALWLKTGTGTSGSPTVTAWADQSGNSNHTNISDPIGSPQLISNAINYNPAIEFDGPKDYFETSTTSLIGSNNPYTKYVVMASGNLSKEMGIISSDGSGNVDMRQSDSGQSEATHKGISLLQGANLVLDQPTIFGLRYGGGPLDNLVSVNGDIVVDNSVKDFADDGTTQIGAWQGSYNFEGVIAEAIIYTTEVSDIDIKKIESYLAIKYGLTLSNAAGGIAGDYLASNSNLIWDASANSGYHNDVAGIGRDDNTALDQQKSLSINSDAMVIIAKGAAFGTDLDYIIWGNDDGATTLTTTDKVPAFVSRLSREWKVGVNGTPGTVTVRMIYAANNGNASDYALHVDADGSFASGATSYVASSISGDTITFNGVSFANGDYFTLGDNISPPTVAFNNTSSDASESVSSADLAVAISKASGLDVSVDYTVTGTATGAGSDYTLADGTLTIKAGDADNKEDITIASIVDDLIDEVNETVIVTLSNPVNATLGANTIHIYTIIDNDVPTIAFNNTSSQGLESVSSADLTVAISAVSGSDVAVDYKVTGTGAGSDYTLADGTLTIKAGDADNKEDITIASIIDDAIAEGNETVIVTLLNPTNATLGANTVHTYTIIDNDGSPTVAFSNTSSSGLESVSSADLTVAISVASSLDVSVDYTVTGTATGAGTDYTLANGTLTIKAGDADNSENITIASIIDDAITEGNETVVVTLSNPTNAILGVNTVYTYTIIDNDTPPIVAFISTSSNGMESVSSADLAVDISAASGLDVSVDYTITGTATGAGTDYTLANGTLTIKAGDADNSENITIASIIDDAITEGNETVVVTLSNPTNAILGVNTVYTYTIIDNDTPPIVAFISTSSNGMESVSSADLAVDISKASGLDVSVDYTVTGTATGAGSDYTLADGTLTIKAGDADNKEDITIASIVDDLIDEVNETVIVTLSNPVNATLGANTIHIYTIIDNDVPTIAFNNTSSQGLESVSSADLTVAISAVSGSDVAVDYKVTGTGAGSDYTLADGTLTIKAGDADNKEDITIASIIDDAIAEGNETVIVTLLNPTNATLGANTVHTYTIIDNDGSPTVAFSNTSSSGLESVSSADLTVAISVASSLDVSVDYTVTGTATGTGTDYTLADGTLTFSAVDEDIIVICHHPLGNPTNTQTMEVVASKLQAHLDHGDEIGYCNGDKPGTSVNVTIASIVDDLLNEANETVIVTLSNPINATLGANTEHTYTIMDNDVTPTVAFNNTNSSGLESVSSADLAVDISAASGLDVSVDYTVTGTATGAGTDYTLANGTLTIKAGDADNSENITIASIIDDAITEGNETVVVTLSNPTNAILGVNTVYTYTIIDNDTPPIVAFISTSSNGMESVSSADLAVDISVANGLDVSIDYTVTGTATGGGIDYTLANGTLTIPAGATSGTITISSIIDDLLDETDETVIVTLSGPVNAILGMNTVYSYTIVDNEAAPVAVDDLNNRTQEDMPITITSISSNDTDVDGTVVPSSIILVDPNNTGNTGNNSTPLVIPGVGTYTIDIAGALVFTPALNFIGSADVAYTIEDNDGLVSNAATIAIEVLSQNDAPVADDDIVVVNEGASVTIDIVNGDNDADGTLNLSSILISNLTNGSVAVNGDGTVDFVHDGSETTSASFTYTIEDNEGMISNVATVSISVTPVNDAPSVINDAVTIDEGEVLNGPSLLSKVTDAEGDALIINTVAVVDVANGTLTIQADGFYTYTPDAGFVGADSFTYEVCDGQGGCATAQVLITIISIDDDGDGILNVDEGTVDTDGDGIPDYQDIDSDNDNILDAEEGNIDTDGDGTPNFRDLDSDDDGFSDLVETNNDCDADGTPNYLDLDRCDLTIPKGISPNGDGVNDEWIIQGIEQYPENNVKIYNRWGNKVYEENGYDNLDIVWTGKSTGILRIGIDEVTNGSYFYVIDLGVGTKPLGGYVVIKR